MLFYVLTGTWAKACSEFSGSVVKWLGESGAMWDIG